MKSCPCIVHVSSFKGDEIEPSPRKTKGSRYKDAKFNVGPFKDDAKMRDFTVADLGESRFICL